MLTFRAIAALCYFCFYYTSALSIIERSEPFFRKDYAYVVQQEAWYKVHREPRSWFDAYQYCKVEGGALLYPRDQAEDTLLDEMVEEFLPNNTHTWVGAHDLFAAGVYVDLQGNEISDYLARWSPGEPRTDHNQCVVKDHNGLINQESCDRLYPFVCKKSIHEPVVPTACGTIDTGYVPNAAFTRCYKLHKQPKNWPEAYAICRAEQAYLVVIDDEEEAQFVAKTVKPFADKYVGPNYHNKYTLVGFHDRFVEGDYLTIHGKNLNEVYNQWAEDEPNNRGGSESYGSIQLSDARLSDFNDYERTLFVCEKEIEHSSVETTTPIEVGIKTRTVPIQIYYENALSRVRGGKCGVKSARM